MWPSFWLAWQRKAVDDIKVDRNGPTAAVIPRRQNALYGSLLGPLTSLASSQGPLDEH